MSLTLLAPALLSAAVPDLVRRNVRLPALEALCAAGAVSLVDQTPERWLCAQLGVKIDAEPPLAALRLAAEAPSRSRAAVGYWLCADPVATTLGMDSVRIDRRIGDLTAAQAAALSASLSGFFGRDGLQFTAIESSRWYVHCQATQRLATTPLWRALGTSMLAQMPAGEDAPAWRARLNEAQMLLHQHPVNVEREAAGLPAVASIWWWGGGAAPDLEPTQFDIVTGGPRWVRGACELNHIAWLDASGSRVPFLTANPQRALHIIDGEWEDAAADPGALVRWDGAWFAPLRSALVSGQADAATLLFPWNDGMLRIGLGPARNSHWPGWRRWFGFSATPAPAAAPLAESLQAFLQ